jgi:hypothetical protein
MNGIVPSANLPLIFLTEAKLDVSHRIVLTSYWPPTRTQLMINR